MIDDLNDLTPEEKRVLKEVAQNFMAANRLGQLIKAWALGLAATIGAGVFLWEFVLKR